MGSISMKKKVEAAAESPRLCVGGCGFYGSAEKMGYCSYCYPRLKELGKLSDSLKSLRIDTTSSGSESSSSSAPPPPRCGSCEKKLRLSTTFACRCERNFCAAHRLPELHRCTYDYKGAGKDAIKTQNPLCKADKLASRIN